jgi:hypothetical protein
MNMMSGLSMKKEKRRILKEILLMFKRFQNPRKETLVKHLVVRLPMKAKENLNSNSPKREAQIQQKKLT